jgi:hypothetical protein
MLQAAEPVGENIAGNPFVGIQQFFEATVTQQHHVPYDKQGPAIAEHFDRCV